MRRPSGPRVRWLWSVARRVGSTLNRQIDHWPLWRPVAFGLGDALYFGADEPYPTVLALGVFLGSLAAAALCIRARSGRAYTVGVILICFSVAGFLAADFRTRLVAAPVIPENLGRVRIVGDVIDIRAASAERLRILIIPVAIGDLPARAAPARLRVVTMRGGAPAPGDRVVFTAILNPPAGPSTPEGYNFARDAYFERIGAVGAAIGPLIKVGEARVTIFDALEMNINKWRWSLANRLTSDLRLWTPISDDAAGLAAAVTTSHEAWMSQSSEDALRGAGLAHMLAIAGLHTAAISGFAYWTLRWGFAACPPLALRAPGKTVAAAGGLIAVVGYLALSGAHPPARRAAITAALAFIAMILGRRAISLHALSIAALAVLALEPECVTQPGFQMSFCATGALIALAEAMPTRKRPAHDIPFVLAVLQRLLDGLAGLATVATVAGFATAPFAAQHFNQVTLYGTPANLLADFLASVMLMPGIAIAVVGEAFNLHHSLLAPAFWCISIAAEGVIAVGRIFSGLPSAQIRVSSAPPIALSIAFFGLVFAILWKGRLRWIGAVAALAVFIWPRAETPIGWLAENGDNAAHVLSGSVYSLRADHQQFALESFAKHHGLSVGPTPDSVACGRDYCVDPQTVSPRIGVWFTRRHPGAERLRDLCNTDILLLKVEVNLSAATCSRPLVLSPAAFRRFGAAEILPRPGGWRLDWVRPHLGARPWSRPSPLAY